MKSGPRDCITATIAALNERGIAHMITGSLATNVYGIPRMTMDADFVVTLRDGDLEAVAMRVAELLRLDRQQSFETATLSTRWRFRGVSGGFDVELFELTVDPFDETRFARRRPIAYLDLPTWIPTAEDVLVQKLRWAVEAARRKDLDDARNVILVRGSELDWGYIRRWTDEHGSSAALDELLRATDEQ